MKTTLFGNEGIRKHVSHSDFFLGALYIILFHPFLSYPAFIKFVGYCCKLKPLSSHKSQSPAGEGNEDR